MTDAAHEPTHEPTLEEVKKAPDPLTDEQIAQFKQQLLLKASHLYREFLTSIDKLPGNEKCKQNAFNHFDTGYLWVEHAIKNLS